MGTVRFNRVAAVGIAAAVLVSASFAADKPPISLKLLSVKKIWDRGRHNAFTDLIRFQGRFYCVFREGAGHVSNDGKIRALVSADGEAWKSAALLALKGYDLRDAKISQMPDGRLMILGGAAPRKARELVPTSTFVSFSKDAATWTQPKIVARKGRWLWRVTWFGGKGYGVDYGGRKPSTLLVTEDGLTYRALTDPLCNLGQPNEATLRFTKGGTCYCLHRRRGSALLGVAKPPYKKWTWKDLGHYIGGPDMIQLPSGDWIGSGRLLKPTRTSVFAIDVDAGKTTELLRLPSGGDTSYPGLVWHKDILWISYYASHEGRTSIYLAKVKIGPARAKLSRRDRRLKDARDRQMRALVNDVDHLLEHEAKARTKPAARPATKPASAKDRKLHRNDDC